MISYKDGLAIIGGLSAPSKMPWFGWSISAKHCVTGKKLHLQKGTTCSNCYALKGRYMFSNVTSAHDRRLAGLSHPQYVEAFVAVLNHLYKGTENRFRWFDAGDLQSADHLRIICEIAKRTPNIRHWLPTREYGFVRQYVKTGGVIPDNLVIRMSHNLVGKSPTKRLLGLPYSTVDVDNPALHQCPAPTTENKCKSCDACWTKKDVNYHAH